MKTFRWFVRILSLPYILLHVISFSAEGLSPGLSRMDLIKLALWALILLGMVLAFKWERFGGGMIVGGFLIQVGLNPAILGLWPMWIAPGIGVLFLVSGSFASRRLAEAPTGG
jgi:hypothetical protein